MKQKIIDIISRVTSYDVILEKPKDKSLGHFATPVAFSLAKELKKSPMIIAQELAQLLDKEDSFESVSALNGFINIKLSSDFLDTYINNIFDDESSLGRGADKNEKILLEYVSANPTGPLHIGHARGAVVGDALTQIGRHCGYNITTEYYINDAGNQVDLLGVSLQLSADNYIFEKQDVVYPEQYYKGEYINDLALEIHKEYGDAIFASEKFTELCNIGKEKMMALVKQNLADVHIQFDNFVSEKSLFGRWAEIQKRLEANGALYLKNDKLWLKSTEYGDELDRVVVRENGIPTYLAGDIIYHEDKYSRNFDSYINIWGADHHGYIARVKAAIKYLGNDESKLEVLLAQMVALLKDGEPYKMSKRAGNFILMSDVVEDIGNDALRFIFLSKKMDTHLDFDVATLSKQDATNPIFYINYAHARIHSLIAKAGISIQEIKSTKIAHLEEDSLALVFEALSIGDVLEDSFRTRSVQKVTEYLKSLAASVHSFYNANRIIGNENDKELLKVLLISSLSIKMGLKLLGITAKDSM